MIICWVWESGLTCPTRHMDADWTSPAPSWWCPGVLIWSCPAAASLFPEWRRTRCRCDPLRVWTLLCSRGRPATYVTHSELVYASQLWNQFNSFKDTLVASHHPFRLNWFYFGDVQRQQKRVNQLCHKWGPNMGIQFESGSSILRA